jgi:nucleoside-triphosphatase THEP1
MKQVISGKFSVLLAVLAVISAALFLIPGAALAQDSCDIVVVDEVGAFGDRLADVQAAADSLINEERMFVSG